MFNKEWFAKYQSILLWFANTYIGKWILRINGKRSSIKNNEIVAILPNAIFWKGKKKKEYIAEFRTSNKFSNRIKYAFYPLWWLMHQWDLLIANQYKPAWNLGLDTLTVYAGSGDGECKWEVSGAATWAAFRDGTTSETADTAGTTAETSVEISGGRFYGGRSFYPFDTSALTSNATISAATFTATVSTSVGAGPWINDLIQTSQASTSALATTDWDAVAFTSASQVDTAGGGGAFNFAMNATGLTWISKTGFTKLGLIDKNDLDNTAPTGTDKHLILWKTSETAGTADDPKLVITYTLPAVSGINSFKTLLGVGL